MVEVTDHRRMETTQGDSGCFKNKPIQPFWQMKCSLHSSTDFIASNLSYMVVFQVVKCNSAF